MCFEIMDEDFRFRYHHPLPNFYKVSNPANPKTQIDNSVLKDLEKLAAENNCAGISYSKLSDDFRKEWNIDFDNVIIFKYLMSPEILEMESSKLKCKLTDDEFIITQTNKGEPAVINKKAPSGKAYVEIARRILGENVDVTIPGKDEKFLDKIKNVFRKK